MYTLTIDSEDVLTPQKKESTQKESRELSEAAIEERRKAFAQFCGIWTDEEYAEFEEATKDLRTVDPRDWE